MCSYYSSLVSFAEWPPFGKELLTRLTTCSLFNLTICNFIYFRLGFEGGIWVLIVPVPGHCIRVAFVNMHCKSICFSRALYFRDIRNKKSRKLNCRENVG